MAANRTGAQSGTALSMGQMVPVCLALTAAVFFLPVFMIGGEPLLTGEVEMLTAPEPGVIIVEEQVEQTMAPRDRGRIVRLQQADGTVEELTMDTQATPASLKTLSETLKNIRDAQMIKSSKDLQEQQTRIEKMQKDMNREGEARGGVTVTLEKPVEEFSK